MTRLSEQLDDSRFDEIVAALEQERGDVTRAARLLKVQPVVLRRKILADNRLMEVQEEIQEQAVDKAVTILKDGMNEGSYLVRFYAAKEFVRSEAGRRRGFGAPSPMQATIQANGGGTIVLKWIDDEKPEASGPKLIEGTVE